MSKTAYFCLGIVAALSPILIYQIFYALHQCARNL